MAVRDEIVGKTFREAANIKAQRHADALPSMTRPYTRGGYRFTIDEFGIEVRTRAEMYLAAVQRQPLPYLGSFEEWIADTGVDRDLSMLRLVVTVRQAPNGPFFITATDPLNPMYFINPPIMVQDGDEDDPTRPGYKRPTYREDLTEALRQVLDAKLAEKLRA